MGTRQVVLTAVLPALMAFFAVVNVGIGQTVIGDFEAEQTGWTIPDWALEKPDHVGKKTSVSDEVAKSGKKSLKVEADFTGKKSWEAAYVELEEPLNMVSSNTLAVDIYLPENAPPGLAAQFCLSVGDAYTWTEQLKNVPLKPGQWTTIEVSIAPGSAAWKKTKVDENFRMEFQKVGIRLTSNKKAVYSGPIFIDNVRGIVDSPVHASPDDGSAVVKMVDPWMKVKKMVRVLPGRL